ncbi:MAG: hypothetical protein VB959_13835 [Rhodospirillales bacterium]
MKAFTYSVVAVIVVSALAAFVLLSLDLSAADVFQLKDVRL